MSARVRRDRCRRPSVSGMRLESICSQTLVSDHESFEAATDPSEHDADLPLHRHRRVDPAVGGVARDARPGGAALRARSAVRWRASAARSSPRWATASPPRSRRPTPPSRRRSPPQRQMPTVGLERADGRPHRRGRAGRRRLPGPAGQPGRAHHGRRATAARSCCRTCRPRWCASGPSPVELADLGTHRLRDLDRARAGVAGRPPRARRRASRRCAALDTCANNLPAQRSSLIGRDRDVARVVDLVAAAPHRHAHRRRRGGQDPAGRAGRRRSAARGPPSVWFVELASVADPDDVADAIAAHHGPRRRRPTRWPRSPRCWPASAHAAGGRQLRARRRQRRRGRSTS